MTFLEMRQETNDGRYQTLSCGNAVTSSFLEICYVQNSKKAREYSIRWMKECFMLY